MIGKNEKLRRTSESIFQEADPPKDRSRPLEWRRRFNFIDLPLRNVQIVNSCAVHDTEFHLIEEKEVDPVTLLRTNLSTKTAITGILDEVKVRDRFYFAVKNTQEEGIYSVERPQGQVRVTLKAGEPTEESDSTPGGLYLGNAFRLDFEPGEDDLCIDLSFPEKQINSLIAALRADENAVIEVGADLLSFTFEVDDALREHYDPRDIVIDDSTLCFASWASVKSKIGQHLIQRDSEPEEVETDDEHRYEMTAEQRSHQELMQVLSSYSKPLNGLVKAMWALVIVIALHAFFNQ